MNQAGAPELVREFLQASQEARKEALRKEREAQELGRSEKLAAVGQLAAGLSHEVNNPLTAILAFGELLIDEISEESARNKVDKILREAQRARRIIEHLLHFTRQSRAEKKATNLEPLIKKVVELLEYTIRTRSVNVQLEIEPQLPPVTLDGDQFKQILLNLLHNAIDALQPTQEKQIRIAAYRREGWVVLCVDASTPWFYQL